MKTPPERRKTPEEGAATSTFLAVSPLVDGIGGRYFEDSNEAPVVSNPTDYQSGVVAERAIDPESAERLWHESVRLLA